MGRRIESLEKVAAREFVLLSGQRCGSTLLIRSLDAAEPIYCAGEILHPSYGVSIHKQEHQFVYPHFIHSKLTIALNGVVSRKKVVQHLSKFYGAAEGEERARGFKLMKSQLDWNPTVLPFLLKRGVAFITLRRDSDFDTALSMCKAMHTGQYHSEKEVQEMRFDIPCKTFARQMKRAEQNRLFFERFAQENECLSLSYECLTEQWEDTILKVGNHLGISNLQVDKSLKKLDVLGKITVTNLDELRERFDK